MLRMSLPIALFFILAPFSAGAEARKGAQVVTITLDENSLPMVSVTLHSLKSPNVTRALRFVLDTGSDWCVVDQSVPAEYFWDEDQIDATPRDVGNLALAASTVLLKRMDVGGLTRDGIIATRMNLRQQFGPFQDQPMDGILGMSFLRGTRFLLEPQKGHLLWWGNHFRPGVTVPILGAGEGIPRLTLRLGNQEVAAIMDTGMGGGVDLPLGLRPKGEGKDTYTRGATGTLLAGSEIQVERLAAGTSAWVQLPVNFEGEAAGRIGVDVWLAAPVCFDFVTHNLTFSLDADGNLPMRRDPGRKLPIIWDRSGPSPRLIVMLVKPESAMEKAGCRAGDVLLRAGTLHAEMLTRRAVQELVASGAEHKWLVRRHGEEVELRFGPH